LQKLLKSSQPKKNCRVVFRFCDDRFVPGSAWVVMFFNRAENKRNRSTKIVWGTGIIDHHRIGQPFVVSGLIGGALPSVNMVYHGAMASETTPTHSFKFMGLHFSYCHVELIAVITVSWQSWKAATRNL